METKEISAIQVTGIARGQWNNLCTKKEVDNDVLDYKIRRAYYLGKVTHKYKNGEYIVRYHSLNLLVSNGYILTIWRDKSRPSVFISEDVKEEFKAQVSIDFTKEDIKKAKLLKSVNIRLLQGYNKRKEEKEQRENDDTLISFEIGYRVSSEEGETN